MKVINNHSSSASSIIFSFHFILGWVGTNPRLTNNPSVPAQPKKFRGGNKVRAFKSGSCLCHLHHQKGTKKAVNKISAVLF